jgi:hypothetical protein
LGDVTEPSTRCLKVKVGRGKAKKKREERGKKQMYQEENERTY